MGAVVLWGEADGCVLSWVMLSTSPVCSPTLCHVHLSVCTALCGHSGCWDVDVFVPKKGQWGDVAEVGTELCPHPRSLLSHRCDIPQMSDHGYGLPQALHLSQQRIPAGLSL